MNIFTLDRDFKDEDLIDDFVSAIWTERYKGDGDFKIIVKSSGKMLDRLSKGRLMRCEGSAQPMILETRDVKNKILEATGITLTQWLNNRFIRTTNDPKAREWAVTSTPGAIINQIVQYFAMPSIYNDGTVNVGIASAITELFPIPGLVQGAVHSVAPAVTINVPFGPLYEPMKQIADTYDIGMGIFLEYTGPSGYMLSFSTYGGEDRTSSQTLLPIIQFSEDLDTFTNIHDLESLADYRNYFFIFPSTDVPVGYANGPGILDASNAGEGFDLRVFQGFADKLPDGTPTNAQIHNALVEQAKNERIARKVVQLVDGEIVQVGGIEYGTDYFLGDIVEAVGNLGVIQRARVTEYIRSKDVEGERAYPTLTFLD